ncbi:MAG: S-layer homology domain-containing protein, partial [Acidimicrobiia bacterium]
MRTTTNPDRSTRPLPKLNIMMVVLAMTVVAGAGVPTAADAAVSEPQAAVSPFVDVANTDPFAEAIVWLAEEGITQGCNPPTNDRFCPDDSVTRGQMAAFLVRAFGYTDAGSVDFADDNGSVFESDIERLATARVTLGCNPPTNDRFCPDDRLTRGQMAAFLVRAFGYTDAGSVDFADDNGSVFESDIERLATAGVTLGCNPPTNDRFCPDDRLTRGQMAAFLW